MRFLLGWITALALLIGAVPAHAQWANIVNDNFSRANTSAGGAGSTSGAGNNWIDVNGSTWSINSDTLLATNNANYGNFLLRPTGEDLVGSRIDVTTVAGQSGASGVLFGAVLRYVSSAPQYYLAQYSMSAANGYTITIYVYDGGRSALAGPVTYTAPANGDTVLFSFSVTGTGTKNLNVTVTDVTTGANLGSVNTADGTAALNTTGQQGVVIWPFGSSGTLYFSNIATYSATPAGTSIAVSPTSLTAGTTANTVTVTGTNTSFTGTPFTATGGPGASIGSQSVSSTTAGTMSLSVGAGEGIYGANTITIMDTISGATAAITVAPPSLGALKIGWIGDSITAGTNGNPVAQAAAYLTALGYTVTSVNEAQSGTSTADWTSTSGGSNMANALAAFSAAGVTIVHVMLGTNDVRSPNNFSTATYLANMTTIINTLKAHNYKVVISKPPYTVPYSAGTWPADPNSAYLGYFQADMGLVDGVNVFQGDTAAFTQSMLAPATFLATDGIHPANSTENNILGDLWGIAIQEKFGAAGSGGGGGGSGIIGGQ